MIFKSKLGIAALEELTQDPAVDEAAEVEKVETETEAADAAADAATTDAAATDTAAAAGDDAAAAADAGAAEGEAVDAEVDAAAAEGEATGEKTEGEKEDAADAKEADQDAADVEAVEEPVVGEEVEGGETAELISEETEEADKAAENAEAVASDVESLQEATESLTTTLEILQSSMQVGGLQAHGAMLLRQNVRMALESIDQSADAILLPAMEDAETPSSRMGMAQDAIEAIKKFLARCGQTIAGAWKQFSDFISKLWGKLTDANQRIIARANKLKEMAASATFAEKITSQKLLAELFIGSAGNTGLVDQAKKVFAGAEHLADTSTYDGYLDALEEIETGTKNKKDAAEIEVAANAHLKRMHDEVAKAAGRAFVLGTDRNLKQSASGGESVYLAMPGNRHVILWIPTKVEEIGGMHTYANELEDYNKDKTYSDIPALDASGVKVMCDAVIGLATKLAKNSEGAKSIKAYSDAIKKKSDTILTLANTMLDISLDEKNTKPFERKVIVWTQKIAYSIPTLPCVKISRAMPGVMSTYLDAVAASIASTKPAEEKK